MSKNVKWGIGIECEFPILVEYDKEDNSPVYKSLSNSIFIVPEDSVDDESVKKLIKTMIQISYDFGRMRKDQASKHLNIIRSFKQPLIDLPPYETDLREDILNQIVENFVDLRREILQTNFKEINDPKVFVDKLIRFNPLKKKEQTNHFKTILEYINSISEKMKEGIDEEDEKYITLDKILKGSSNFTLIRLIKDIITFQENFKEITVINFEKFDFYNSEDAFKKFKIHELKNSNPYVTVNVALKEIKQMFDTIKNYVEEALPGLKNYLYIPDPYSPDYSRNKGYYHLLTEDGKKIRENYLGSYHLNLTMPYKIPEGRPDINFLQDFAKTHTNLMKAIQYIEPLILALFTNVQYETFNDNHQKYENTYRFFGFFIDNEGQKRFVAPGVHNYLNFLNVNIWDQWEEDYIDPKKPNYKSNYQGTTQTLGRHYNLENNELLKNVLQKLNFDLPGVLGADFRFTERFHNIRLKKFFGFEFRMLDLFSLVHLEYILNLIYMLAEYTKISENVKKNLSDINPVDVFSSNENLEGMSNQIVDIIQEGWNSKVNSVYKNILEKYLDFDILPENNNCYDVLNNFYKYLQNFCKTNENKLMFLPYVEENINEKLTNQNDFPNINKQSYNYFMNLQINRNQNLKSMIDKYVSDETIVESNYMQKLVDVVDEDKQDAWEYIKDQRKKMLQTGGFKRIDYKKKYIKYKSKYLRLKS